MPTRFDIAHEFDCSVERYFAIFWDEAFNEAQYQRMGCTRRVTHERDTPEQRERDQEICPQRGIPTALKTLLGGGTLCYLERGIFAKPLGPLRIEISVPALGERFSMKALYEVSSIADTRCRRRFHGECQVRVPLLGGKAEQLIVTQMAESYEAAATLHREWLARSPG